MTAAAGLSEGRVGRYILEDLVAENAAAQLWRATDPVLRRPVGVRLVPLDQEHAPGVRAAARAVAGVHDRRVVQVLDVVETDHYLAVISEWVSGRPLSELLWDGGEPYDAVVVAYEVARALQSAHRAGVTHGRLRPSSVLITETGEARVRGLGVDAALYGVAPGSNARRADLHGVGSMLYLGLTGRWPDPDPAGETLDGVPVIGPVGRTLPTPAEVTAGVPDWLSNLAASCLLTSPRHRLRRPIPDMDAAVAALARAVEQVTGSLPVDDFDPAKGRKWTITTGAVAVLVVAAIATGAAMTFGNWFVARGNQAESTTIVPFTADEAQNSIAPIEPIPVVAASDFDPQGRDRAENPKAVPMAIDDNDSTAWKTVRYKRSTMDPKTGTGLLLDLGLSRPIRAVSLKLVGVGSSVEVRISDTRGAEASDYELLAGAVAVNQEVTLRVPVPVETRYVLVWLTNLPYTEGAYQGGVRDVEVLG